jgi:vacuolar-type H+-ATPase subunit E/Vma4
MEYNTNDELRAYFIKQIQSISEQEISKVKEEIERINQKKLSEIEASATLSADLMLQQETKILNSEHSLNISKLTEQNNRKKAMMREQLIKELFNTITKKLKDYTQSEAYQTEFTNDVKKFAEQYPYNGTLHISASDQALATHVIKNVDVKLEVVVDESISIGGFFLEFIEASLVVDQTLDAKLRDEMNAFYENPELILK